MTIHYLQDLARPGAAVFAALADIPCGARQMRVLRRWDANFPDAPVEDAETFAVFGGAPQTGVLDWHGLVPDIPHWYAVYYLVDDAWQRAEPQSIVPTRQVHPPSLDSLDAIRERVEIGLNALLDAGHLRHPRGRFTVLTAPPLFDDVAFPAVAVHLEQATPDQHFIGGFIGEERLENGCWQETAGWRSRYAVSIEAWSLNPDERRLLRRAIRDTVIAARDVLEMIGLQELEATVSDDEDFQSYNAPLYRTQTRLSYLAPDVVWSVDPAIDNVIVACGCRDDIL
jgi:hypothetical protein